MKDLSNLDFTLGDENVPIRTLDALEIRDQLHRVVKILKLNGHMSAQEIADLVTTKRQTLYQYVFHPDARGARTIPATSLEILQNKAMEIMAAQFDRYYPAFMDREARQYQYIHADTGEIHSTTYRAHAIFAAARLGVEAFPGPKNTGLLNLTDNENLSLQWLRAYHSGFVSLETATDIARVDRYLIGRVGCEFEPWNVQPTQAMVDTIVAFSFGKWSQANAA